MAGKNGSFLRNHFVAHLVVAGKKNPLARKPSRGAFTRARPESGVFRPVSLEVLAEPGPDQYRVARLNLDALGFGGRLKIFGCYLLSRVERIDVLESSYVQKHRSIYQLLFWINLDSQLEQPGRALACNGIQTSKKLPVI